MKRGTIREQHDYPLPVAVVRYQVVQSNNLTLSPVARANEWKQHPANVAPRDRSVDVADHDAVPLSPEVDVARRLVSALEPRGHAEHR